MQKSIEIVKALNSKRIMIFIYHDVIVNVYQMTAVSYREQSKFVVQYFIYNSATIHQLNPLLSAMFLPFTQKWQQNHE